MQAIRRVASPPGAGRRLAMFIVALGGAGVGAGCVGDSVTEHRLLAIDLEVTPATAAVADTVTARFTVTGGGLLGVIVDWGDGAADSLPLNGAVVEVEWSLDHSYLLPGEFAVVAVAEDQQARDSATALVTVR